MKLAAGIKSSGSVALQLPMTGSEHEQQLSLQQTQPDNAAIEKPTASILIFILFLLFFYVNVE
jgi:hypothetical protein